jgi:hypothetical protein
MTTEISRGRMQKTMALPFKARTLSQQFGA